MRITKEISNIGNTTIKRFTNIKDALRTVKDLSREIRILDQVFLAYSDKYKLYFVTHNYDELLFEIYLTWFNSGCLCSPDKEASTYKVLEYLMAEKKSMYPNVYKSSKRSLIKSPSFALIRRNKQVNFEYLIDV